MEIKKHNSSCFWVWFSNLLRMKTSMRKNSDFPSNHGQEPKPTEKFSAGNLGMKYEEIQAGSARVQGAHMYKMGRREPGGKYSTYLHSHLVQSLLLLDPPERELLLTSQGFPIVSLWWVCHQNKYYALSNSSNIFAVPPLLVLTHLSREKKNNKMRTHCITYMVLISEKELTKYRGVT